MFEVNPLKKISKQGKEYIVLEIVFPNGYKKLCFLEKAEEYMMLPYMN